MTTKLVESFVVDYTAKAEEPIFDYGEVAEYPPTLYDFQGSATGVDGFKNVGDEQIAAFQEQGYLVVNNAFTADEVQGALDGLLYLISGQNTEYKGVMLEKKAKGVPVDTLPPEQKQDYVRKFMWFVDHDPRLKALAEHPQLIAVLTRLLGEAPLLFQDMAMLKPPRIGREKPWHQDHAYFDLPLSAPVVGVWIALDEATTENGCMLVYPGSHRAGPVVHFSRRDWQICDTQERTNRALAVPLKPGGVLFFHSLMQHGTPANTSTARRRAVQFHYKASGAPTVDQAERLAVFGSEGKNVTC